VLGGESCPGSNLIQMCSGLRCEFILRRLCGLHYLVRNIANPVKCPRFRELPEDIPYLLSLRHDLCVAALDVEIGSGVVYQIPIMAASLYNRSNPPASSRGTGRTVDASVRMNRRNLRYALK
jgi:hypothetical protein